MRVFEAILPIGERLALESFDATAGSFQDRLARRGVPFHGTAEAGIDVCLGAGKQAELKRRACRYPILDLEQFYTDIGKYLRNLEEVIIKMLAD